MSAGEVLGPLTDLHSHLVPGVDDGARSVEDALEGLGRMIDRGIGRVITTPHLDASVTREADQLAKRLADVDEALGVMRAAALDRFPGLELARGHEVRLDRPDPDLSDARVRLDGSDVVLVEWPRLVVPPETPKVLRDLRAQGVTPLIAHPERYQGYGSGLTLIRRWRDEGALLQVNYGSLADRYGPQARSVAVRLLEMGVVDCLASDFHGRAHLRLYIEEARRTFEDLDAMDSWDMLTRANPSRILRGDSPLPVPPVSLKSGILDRIRSLLGR